MSATVSSTATQQKFSGLRKRLDQLGYRQPLGLESLPLVERLFSDLIHTTDSLKKSKLQLTESSSDNSHVDSHIEPYKNDNAKLVKETNELHKQLIKVTEESQTTIKELKANLRKFEHDNADLKFLNNQYVHKIRALEQESTQKSDRILQLQEKNFHAVVQTPGGRKKNIPFRRQRMEIESVAPPVNITVAPRPTLTSDPYIADLLKIADSKIAEMREEGRIHVEEKEGFEGRIKNLRNQVETRDTEIDRLSRLLEGGRPYDVVALESRNRSNERLISHLNIQVDYLQQKNHDLQLQADAALSKATTAASHTMEADIKNTELNHELQTVDRMAQQLQLDKDSVVRSADMQLSDVNVELHKARDELENMDLQIAQFRAENDRLRIDNSDLKSQLSSEQVNRDTMDGLLQRVQDDKHKLGRRINKLLANEKELVLEIDRLKHRTSCGTKKKSAKTPNRVEALLKSVEQERDYWKGEVDILQKISSSRALSPSRSPSRTRSPTRARSPVRSTAKSPVRSRNASPLRSSIEKYESTIRLIEDERDHFKRECELMKSARSTSPSRLSKSYSEDLGELSRVMKERDELQVMLNKFERHMSEIQTNVKVLTSERDKVSILYEETREELARLRRDVVRSPKSPKTSLAAQAVLRRVENERDDSLNELRRTATERDSLRERLKLATETQLADRARLEQRIEELELITRTAERERSEQLGHSDLLRTRVNDVETELNEQRHQSSSAKDEAVQQKATATQMRLLAEQAEHALEDSQFRLTRKEAELRNVEEKLVLLEQRVAELSQTNQSERNAGTQLKATISSLDREKDSLQICIDEKTENIVILDNEIALKEATITELRATIADIESSLMRAQDVVVSKDHEIASLRRQVDGTTGDLSETVRSRDVALRENRRLQDDLANMTRENQNVNADLQESLVERERLKTQVQEYIGEVKRTEELLAAKDLERNDILEQYRALSLEAEKFETHNHQLESEGSNLRLELMTRENESRRLRERIDLLERDIKELMHTERSYEVQVNSMTKTVATLEDSVRCIDNDKHTLMQDVSAVRDLCTQLEATKDSLQRQLTGATLDREKLQSMLDDSRREAEVLRSQMSTERTSMKNLEHLLSSEREREFHTQLSQQEQSAEIQLLRDRLMLNDTKMETQGRDLTTARSQIMELESEVERVKRQLTNERFERERAAHELRRHGLSPVDTSARLSRLSAGSPSAISPLRNRSRSPSHRSPLRSPLDNNALQSDSSSGWADTDSMSSSTSLRTTSTTPTTPDIECDHQNLLCKYNKVRL